MTDIPATVFEKIRGALHSTYVRTTVCINNTYIHTDALATNTPEIAELGTAEINAYSLSGVHTDTVGGQ